MLENMTITDRILTADAKRRGAGEVSMKTIEALSEVIRVMARGDDALYAGEAMAEAHIRLEQLEIVLGNRDAVQDREVKKLRRMGRRLHVTDVIGGEESCG